MTQEASILVQYAEIMKKCFYFSGKCVWQMKEYHSISRLRRSGRNISTFLGEIERSENKSNVALIFFCKWTEKECIWSISYAPLQLPLRKWIMVAS